MKKIYCFVAFLFTASIVAQTTVYDINTWDLSAGYAEETVVNGITVIPGSSTNTGAVDTGNHTFTDGYQGSKRLKTNGSSYNGTTDWANPNRRYFTLPVSGPSAIKVWYRNGGSGERVLYISEGNTVLGFNSVVDDTDGKIFEANYEGSDPATIKLSAGLNAVNIYKIEVTTSGGGDPVSAEIEASSCNATLNSATNDYVYAVEEETAQQYEFKIVNAAMEEQTIVKSTNSFAFGELGVNNFAYGATYDVSVRLEIDAVWTVYSEACPVSLTSSPVSNMDGFCGLTMPSVNSKIYFELVSQATEYKYSVTNLSTSVEQFVTSSERYFYITDLDNYAFGTDYSVKCQVKIDGEYGEFGPACTLTTPASPPTSTLRDAYCNMTLSNMNQNIYANVVVGSTMYKFKVVNGVDEQEIERPNSRFSMAFAAGIMPSTTYDVSVSIYLNEVWSDYGAVCTITTPANLPTSQLRSQYCGNSVASLASNFYANVVVGATAYKFKTMIDGEEVEVVRNDSRCFMSAFAGATMNQTYTIQVATQFNGVWSAYGNACSLNVGMMVPKVNMTDTQDFDVKAFPNPFMNQITLSLSNQNIQSDVMVYDMTGKLIQQITTEQTNLEIGNDWSKGIYLVQIVQGQETKNIRIVKQ